MEEINLSSMRSDYLKGELDEHHVDENPLVQFSQWMDEALKSEVMEPTAMVLATVGKDFKPSARTVLLKKVEKDGFVFFTNYESKKGWQIAENSQVAITFFWKELERQVRIEGKAVKTQPEISEEYFHSRPLENRLSAASSPQSRKVADRAALEHMKQEVKNRWAGDYIPRPEHWGGYKVIPETIEFWQGRSSRLNDRILYERGDDGKWMISRLAP
jgi:pyridoxamine 5'-phosphate oxidase